MFIPNTTSIVPAGRHSAGRWVPPSASSQPVPAERVPAPAGKPGARSPRGDLGQSPPQRSVPTWQGRARLPAPPHCARHRGQAGEARALRLGACSLRGGQGTKQVLSGNRLCPCVPAMRPRELLTTVTLPS